MHDNRVTTYEPVSKPQFDSLTRKLSSQRQEELRRKRKRQRQARKSNR
jgi:hypothetical protein